MIPEEDTKTMDLFKKDRNLLDAAAELFDLPPDLVAGLPHIELMGNTHFYMERHKGIMSYSSEEIDINGEKCILRVYGENLKLTAMTGDQLRIQGNILKIEWIK